MSNENYEIVVKTEASSLQQVMPSDEVEIGDDDGPCLETSSHVTIIEYICDPNQEIWEFRQRYEEAISRSSSSRSSESTFSLGQPQPFRRSWATTLYKRLFGPIRGKSPLTALMQEASPRPPTTFKEFTTKELRKATNNYSEDRILGTGICSTVYKGILQDKSVVAVKIFRVTRENRSFEFANEIYFLSKTDHVNVVKLLGWCSEIEVPILVLEYIPNGMLFDFLHQKRDEFTMLPLNFRLRVAAEIADALTYLHTEASPTVIHGNLKSLTILLDANYTVKVYSFGISILESDNKVGHTIYFRNNRGYIDPEYEQSGKLTDRSDVYSFGVVLLELLTRKTAIYYSGKDGRYRNLAETFVACMMENRLLDILDPEITTEGLTEQLRKVTNLAAHCLRQKGSERPAMKEVQKELEASRVSTTTHASVPGYQREPTEYDSPN